VQIGSQWWLGEDLRVTRLNDGTILPVITNDTEFENDINPSVSYYNNVTPLDDNIFGKQSLLQYIVTTTGNINNLFASDLPIDSYIYNGQVVKLKPYTDIKESYIETSYPIPKTLPYIVNVNQGVFDMTMQCFGDISYLFNLAQNANVDIDSDLHSNMLLNVDTYKVGNNIIKSKNIIFANVDNSNLYVEDISYFVDGEGNYFVDGEGNRFY
jgi:hypothetical protein